MVVLWTLNLDLLKKKSTNNENTLISWRFGQKKISSSSKSLKSKEKITNVSDGLTSIINLGLQNSWSSKAPATPCFIILSLLLALGEPTRRIPPPWLRKSFPLDNDPLRWISLLLPWLWTVNIDPLRSISPFPLDNDPFKHKPSFPSWQWLL